MAVSASLAQLDRAKGKLAEHPALTSVADSSWESEWLPQLSIMLDSSCRPSPSRLELPALARRDIDMA